MCVVILGMWDVGGEYAGRRREKGALGADEVRAECAPSVPLSYGLLGAMIEGVL